MTEAQLFDFDAGTGKPNSSRIAGKTPASAKAGEIIKVPRLPGVVADAPASVTLPDDWTDLMEELFEKSIAMRDKTAVLAPNTSADSNLIYMDHVALEHGGTLVWNVEEGKPELIRTGAGTAGTFSPDTSTADGIFIIGDFHTHPFTRLTDGDDSTDSAFSGGDLSVTVGFTVFFDIVQSGETLFCSMRTVISGR